MSVIPFTAFSIFTTSPSDNTNPPFGGTYNFHSPADGEKIAGVTGVYKAADSADSCTATSESYVIINNTTGTHKICLTAGAGYRYIYGTEAEMLGSGTDMIKGGNS